MMRSHLAARSARLVLAAAAVTALAATATACGPEDSATTGSSAAPSETASSAEGGAGDTPSANGTTTAESKSGGSESNGESGDKSGYGQSCGTNDLDLTVTWEHEPDDVSYYLVAAKAKSGITCYLDVNTPSVSFGSGADGVASPVGQGGEDPIKLTGSAVAFTGINPKTTDVDGGKQFDNVIIATTEDDSNPAELELPDTATVDKPIVTNWSTNRGETIPRIV